MSNILAFVAKNIYIMHAGEWPLKVKSAFLLAFAATPIYWVMEAINSWWFNNYTFVVFTFTAIVFDHILGSWVHAFHKHDFSLKKNVIGFFTKTILVIMVTIMAEGMTSILGDTSILGEYFGTVARIMVFIYPAGSAFVNSSIITGGVFPPTGWMDRIKYFNKNLKLKEDEPKEED